MITYGNINLKHILNCTVCMRDNLSIQNISNTNSSNVQSKKYISPLPGRKLMNTS